MRYDLDLSRWVHRAREKLMGRRRYRCPCGSTENDKLSYDMTTEVICRGCGDVLGRMTAKPATHLELMG